MMQPVLEIRGLTTVVRAGRTRTTIVDDVGLEVAKGATLGIVGESGSGKSVTMLSVMGLLPRQLEVTSGEALLLGRDLLRLPRSALRRVRGREVAMVFQDPMTALNPVLTIGRQIGEAIRAHAPRARASHVRGRITELIADVGIPDPEAQLHAYPHEFSGGMRQRVVIAMALANRPQLIIADEPTTALDVTVQAQVLELLREAGRTTGAGTVLITHDLALVAEMADRVVVMYAGRIVEAGPVDRVFANPKHPYTAGLLASRPRIASRRPLVPIPGSPPDPVLRPDGCAFHPRCRLGADEQRCRSEVPLLRGEGVHRSACHLVEMMCGGPDALGSVASPCGGA
jgi:peptide/nickel transport system ATP-binding protein